MTTSYKCWEDKTTLISTGINTLTCPTCNDIYFSCENDCDTLDPEFNEKGGNCFECKHHFCISCFFHKGIFMAGLDKNYPEEELYLCLRCCKLTELQCKFFKLRKTQMEYMENSDGNIDEEKLLKKVRGF